MKQLDEARLKWTYVTRGVPTELRTCVGRRPDHYRSGDFVVARVASIGVHSHAEDPWGRRARLYLGDLVVGAYGNRYATDFYEGYVPSGITTHLLTAGGLFGTVASAHNAHGEPTALEVIGSLVDGDGRPLSTESFAAPPSPVAKPPIGTIAVVGSGMNAGKTTVVSGIVRGCASAGFAVGAGKVTGSGGGKDRWSYRDAGAAHVADFLDFGMPSTFGYPLARLARTMTAIRDRLVDEGAEIVVLEIADGLLQPETAQLVTNLVELADAVVFAAVDALSARAGVSVLEDIGISVSAVSGVLTRSPLAAREATAAIGLPVLSPEELATGAALELLDREDALL